MKNILFMSAVMLFSASSFADWKENVECSIQRGSIHDLTVLDDSSKAQLEMVGPHNGETGKVTLTSSLLPSYSVTFSKLSSGITDEAHLTTKLGQKVVAMSSIDSQQSNTITNKFITKNRDYQITITCISEVNRD